MTRIFILIKKMLKISTFPWSSRIHRKLDLTKRLNHARNGLKKTYTFLTRKGKLTLLRIITVQKTLESAFD